MLSPQLRRKVHDLWSLFWSSGLSNPLVAIEQITYLLFVRQLEALDRDRVADGKASIYALNAAEAKECAAQLKAGTAADKIAIPDNDQDGLQAGVSASEPQHDRLPILRW